MPSINMIAMRRSEKKQLEKNMRRLMAIILAEVVAGVALGTMFTVKICHTRTRVANLDIQLAKLQPTVSKIEYYEKATAKLVPKLDLLNDAKKRTLRWHSMMARLSEVLPSQTWLTRIATAESGPAAQQPGKESMSVNLNGISVSQNEVGEAMLRLNSYPDFQRVDLHYTQKAMVGKFQAVEFEIAAAMKTDQKAKEGASSGSAKS